LSGDSDGSGFVLGNWITYIGCGSEYNIFILDTKEGHMWLLETKESRVDGKLSGGLKYQGKLRPGNKAGEIIFEFGKTE